MLLLGLAGNVAARGGRRAAVVELQLCGDLDVGPGLEVLEHDLLAAPRGAVRRLLLAVDEERTRRDLARTRLPPQRRLVAAAGDGARELDVALAGALGARECRAGLVELDRNGALLLALEEDRREIACRQPDDDLRLVG